MKSTFHVIDLFAGAGGLSYGFEQSGFDVALAVERDAWAVETYIANHRNQNVVESDICSMDDSFFLPYRGKIDVVVGGPPCQGFSIAASNRRKKDDSRNELYRQFLRVVNLVQPKVVLIENVKEIIDFMLPDGKKVIDDIAQFMKDKRYCFDYRILNCSDYGVPQDRKRFFLLAVKKEIADPRPDLELLMRSYYATAPSVNEAIGDLPPVASREVPEDARLNYTKQPDNAFQKRMRCGSSILCNHVPMRHTPKTVEKFRLLLKGETENLPEELLPRMRGNTHQISKSRFSQNHRVINGDKIGPTITASFYSSFVHPNQPRNLTVREAARIQTFPDSFEFHGKKTTLSKKLLANKGIFSEIHLDQFNQVGNAVPPLMASCLAKVCLSYLVKANDEIH